MAETVGTVREVSAVVEAANRVWHAARPIVLLVTLDVENAFNTARSFGVPPYLMHLLEDYISQRMLMYDTTVGRRSRPLSGGIAHGSLESPDFWGPTYRRTALNEVTRSHNPRSGYVDDTLDSGGIGTRALDAAPSRSSSNAVLGWAVSQGDVVGVFRN